MKILYFVAHASMYNRVNKANLVHNFFLVCLFLFSTSFGRLCAHHQVKQLYLCDTCYSVWTTVCWQQPVNITHDYTNCCLYRVVPPDDEQQACSKHVEAYYWNKLIENSGSCWSILYRCITMHGQQNFKYDVQCH